MAHQRHVDGRAGDLAVDRAVRFAVGVLILFIAHVAQAVVPGASRRAPYLEVGATTRPRHTPGGSARVKLKHFFACDQTLDRGGCRAIANRRPCRSIRGLVGGDFNACDFMGLPARAWNNIIFNIILENSVCFAKTESSLTASLLSVMLRKCRNARGRATSTNSQSTVFETLAESSTPIVQVYEAGLVAKHRYASSPGR